MQDSLAAPKPHLGSGDGTKTHPTQEWDIIPTITTSWCLYRAPPSQCPIPSICLWGIAPKHRGKL